MKRLISRFAASSHWLRRPRTLPVPSAELVKQLVARRGRWHHRFEIVSGVVTPGNYDPGFLWKKLELPADLKGARVLDIGCSDGYFVKRLVEAGATVLAVDILDKSMTGLSVLEAVLQREIPFLRTNILDLPKHRLGKFDHVLLLGVIYHLPDMCRGLDIVRELCGGTAFIESHVETELAGRSVATYRKANSLNGDITNFWSPTVLCLREMIEDAGFEILREDQWGDRALVAARSHPERSYKYQLAYTDGTHGPGR